MNPHTQAELWAAALTPVSVKRPVEFEIAVVAGPYSALLEITLVVTDSRDGVTPMRLLATRQCPEFTTPRAAVRFLYDKLRDLVEHELREWFEVGGEKPYFPHDR